MKKLVTGIILFTVAIVSYAETITLEDFEKKVQRIHHNYNFDYRKTGENRDEENRLVIVEDKNGHFAVVIELNEQGITVTRYTEPGQKQMGDTLDDAYSIAHMEAPENCIILNTN